MAVDSKSKRASATHLIVPFMHGAFGATAGVSNAERWAVSWMYNGIAITGIIVTRIKWLKRMRHSFIDNMITQDKPTWL